MPELEGLFGIIFTFGTAFGIVYLYLMTRNKERLALIEKGADASLFSGKPRKFQVFKWALLLIGCGFGVFMASLFASNNLLPEIQAYFGMIPIFGGLGLLIAHFIEKKEEAKKKDLS